MTAVLEILKQLTTDDISLSVEAAETVALAMSGGELPPAVVGAFLGGLAARGETSTEIAGFMQALRQRMRVVPDLGKLALAQGKNASAPLVDTCGTGGDTKGTINVSTLAALVLGACGLRVAKHGNRSVTSKCGSADLFEALDVNIMLTPDQAREVLTTVGVVFLFAPLFHPSMKHVVPIRKELKIRTIFNLLGPLLNPLPVDFQLIGVFSREFMERMATALVHTSLKGALIVHSEDGLDEISLAGRTHVIEYLCGKDGGEPSFKEYVIDPADWGLKPANLTDLLGGTLEVNTHLAQRILDPNCTDAEILIKRDMVLLNAASLLALTGAADDIGMGLIRAREAITSGHVQESLKNLVKATGQFRATS